MEDLKGKIEAVLFSAGKKIELEDIAKLCKERDVLAVKNALDELKREYDAKETALMIVEEGTKWKLTVREKFIGTVKKIVDFGAFVEILPGTEGLLHISQIAKERIAKVTDVLQEGDEVKVKVLEIDKSGKIRLSRKEALNA